MNDLKLHFREYVLPDDSIELIATLDLKASTRCKQRDFFNQKQMLKKQLSNTFRQKLYGQIIRAIEMAEYETRANFLNHSFSAEDKIKAAFQELRDSVPQITYD